MNHKIAVIGLGYVGLPLARLLATTYAVVGYDTDEQRVKELRLGLDKTDEISEDILKDVLVAVNIHQDNGAGHPNQDEGQPSGYFPGLYCSADEAQIQHANI